jgi:hypothetical protein
MAFRTFCQMNFETFSSHCSQFFLFSTILIFLRAGNTSISASYTPHASPDHHLSSHATRTASVQSPASNSDRLGATGNGAHDTDSGSTDSGTGAMLDAIANMTVPLISVDELVSGVPPGISVKMVRNSNSCMFGACISILNVCTCIESQFFAWHWNPFMLLFFAHARPANRQVRIDTDSSNCDILKSFIDLLESRRFKSIQNVVFTVRWHYKPFFSFVFLV